MSAFVFQPYQNQSAPTLATLIRDQGAARARALEIGGQASANAVLAGGQASADIGRAVGTTLANLVQIPQQAKQIDLAQKREALGGKQTDEALKSFEDKDLIQKALQENQGDPEATLKALQAAGHASAATAFSQQLRDTRLKGLQDLKTQLDTTKEGLDLAKSLLPEAPTSSGDPATIETFKKTYATALPQIQKILGPELSQHLPAADDPDLLTKVNGLHEFGLTAAQRIQERQLAITSARFGLTKAKDDREKDDYFTKSVSQWLQTVDTPEEYAQALENAKHLGASAETLAKFDPTFSPAAIERAAALAAGKKTAPALGSTADYLARWAQDHHLDPKALTAAQMNQAEAERSAAGREPDAAVSLTPEGVALTARQYAMTGQLPPMGMGKQGAAVRTQIINKAAEIYQGLDLPSQIAAFKANQKSLADMQPKLDALTAFEKTAGKNLQQFVDQAKAVIDSGSPFLNQPVRAIDEKVLGDPKLAAFNAARKVVLPEFARIISNPNLTGALSDSSRQEVETLIPEHATLAQIYAVAKILTTDAGNRRTSMQEQIADIQKRIASPPAGTTPSTAPQKGEKRLINGQLGEWDGKGWKAVKP